MFRLSSKSRELNLAFSTVFSLIIAPAASVGPSIPSVPAASKKICLSGYSTKYLSVAKANSWALPPATILLSCFCNRSCPNEAIFSDLKLLLKLFLGISSRPSEPSDF